MALLDKLIKGDSNLSTYGGSNPPINVGATKSSKLHAYDTTPGYSLNGAYSSEVVAAYNAYSDGVPNPLPQPSILDLNGRTPLKYSEAFSEDLSGPPLSPSVEKPLSKQGSNLDRLYNIQVQK